MTRGQVFVRAQTPSGKWISADVFDLDEESFRAFMLSMLFRVQNGGAMHIMKSEVGDADLRHGEASFQYRTKGEPTDD